MNSKHASDMIVQDLKDSIENNKRDVGEKSAQKENKVESWRESIREK